MSELKPCPFCKVSAPKLEDHITITTPYFFVRCQECGASAKVCRTKGEAVDAWNHRPLEDELVAALGGSLCTELSAHGLPRKTRWRKPKDKERQWASSLNL